ncbi:MAG: FIST C-terminal domain-containing protein [Acidobacteriota bacterium]|nr:FIST C-terminal domain-containing protein [Acidobacteriota bacterium]MDH3785693.1 FIST C-terminal domain-containing protein [Acidobacteriota bacterium]
MELEQFAWTESDGWAPEPPGRLSDADMVLAFGSSAIMERGAQFETLRAAYPGAQVVGCSTAGEIQGVNVSDDSLVITAARFSSSHVESKHIALADTSSSRHAGELLAKQLDTKGLVHVFVISDGTSVNGSELVDGLTENLPSHVNVTGGLSGDGDRFERTFVIPNREPARDTVSALAFYGDRLRVGYGSLGGWDPFGPERLVTRSQGNVLYELDGRSALELYKRYLGEHAAGLPATGLLFPLSMRSEEGTDGLVRTILAVDEQENSVTFAGDVPEGWYARLMKANFDRLVDGASGAAAASSAPLGQGKPELAILISCVGRKMVLKQRTEEEVEAVRDVLGASTVLSGFYSYGEISPFSPHGRCELHNQTMTITTFSEF